MRLVSTVIRSWPKLAWVAATAEDSSEVSVLHGPCMESRADWCAEAVWAGGFAEGDFDRTDRVFGTGVRIRGDAVVFVSSASVMDRLWVIRGQGNTHVSNSLPAILAVTQTKLPDGSLDPLMHTTWGSQRRSATSRVDEGEIAVYWLDNLVLRDRELQVVPKPDSAPKFDDYDQYLRFLIESMLDLDHNLRDRSRRHRAEPLVTVSSGYDSPAIALLSRLTGCERAVTISDANSLWRGSDSGAALAEKIGLSCRSYRRTASNYPNETAVWAASGKAGLLSWTAFDLPAVVCAAYLGTYCDMIWSRQELPSGYTERVQSFLSMSEYRLWAGMLQCPIAFLGGCHAEEINAISRLPEMQAWSVGGDYDRPIPRRMLEEYGLARGSFANRKKDTSHESPFRWPYSSEASKSFQSFLRANGRPAPPMSMISLIRTISLVENLWYKNIGRRLRLPRLGRFWHKLSNPELLFRWANEELKQRYRRGMEESLPADEAGV
jgi:hypothetical protein